MKSLYQKVLAHRTHIQSVVIMAICFLMLGLTLHPAFGMAQRNNVIVAGLDEGIEEIYVNYDDAPLLERFWLESGALWRQLLASAFPKALTVPPGTDPGSNWAETIAVMLYRLRVSTPRFFLTLAVPALRYTPGLEDEVMLPASDPPVPPLVPMEVGDEEAMARGWKYTPSVLIYHTHNTESYRPSAGGRPYVNDNEELTVVRVGAQLAAELEAAGMNVIHSRAHHMDNYNRAYTESLKTVTALLQDSPNIEYVFDIHRDATHKSVSTVNIEGALTARIYIVIGNNQTLGHPNWRKNLAYAQALHKKLEELYPGISRGVLVRDTSRFNQHVRDNAVLIEVGADHNTMEEALRASRFLANAIVELTREKQGLEPR